MENKIDIKFDELFGLGARYVAGEENDFLIRALKKGNKIQLSTKKSSESKQKNKLYFAFNTPVLCANGFP